MAINRQHWTTTTTDEVKVDTPSYYDGDNNYTAIEVVTNFNLNYNLGTACTYILRAYRKHESPNEDIQKAIDHLQFELIKLKTKAVVVALLTRAKLRNLPIGYHEWD